MNPSNKSREGLAHLSFERLEQRTMLAAGITGGVFHDLDGDGAFSGGDRHLAGWVVYLDDNGNGLHDEAETSLVTDALGSYHFADLPPGDYRVRQHLPAGWAPSDGATDQQLVTLIDHVLASGIDFANRQDTTLAAPSVISPTRGDFSPTPIYSWTAVPGAATYELVFEDLTSGTRTLIEVEAPQTTWQPIQPLLPQHTYLVQIRAETGDGVKGRWSLPHTLFQSPAIPVPLQTLELRDVNVTFAWSPVDGADHYDLLVTNVDTKATALRERNVQSTEWTPVSQLEPGDYRWWVRAIAAEGSASSWSSAVELSVVSTYAPQLLQPYGDFTALQPEFTWTAIEGADHYEVRIENAEGGVLIDRDRNVRETVWSPLSPLPADGAFRWMVRAIGSTGTVGPWSVAASATVREIGVPVIAAPLVVDGQLSFTWSEVDGAARYHARVEDIANQHVWATSANIAGTTWELSYALPLGGPYRVIVRAESANGQQGAWSLPADFSLDQPYAPNVESFQLLDGKIAISWTAAPSAVSYEVRVSDAIRRQTLIRGLGLPGTVWSVPTASPAPGSYEVIARAIRSNDSVGPWGEPLPFLIDQDFTPAVTSVDFRGSNLLLAWSDPNESTSYDVRIYDDTTKQLVVQHSGILNRTWTTDADLDWGNVYSVLIRSTLSNGRKTAWSTPYEFNYWGLGTPIVEDLQWDELGPEFQWQPSANASAYDLSLVDRQNGTTVVQLRDWQPTTWRPNFSLAVGSYDLLVRSVASDATRGDWSSALPFQISAPYAPELSAPEIVDHQLLFRWTPIAAADHYELRVVDGVNGGSVVRQAGLPGAEWAVNFALPAGRSYRAMLRGITLQEVNGPWSEVVSFEIDRPYAPVLGAATVDETSLALSWSPIVGASSYELRIFDRDDVTWAVRQRGLASTAWTESLTSLPEHRHRAIVRAIGDAPGPWSEPLEFRVMHPSAVTAISIEREVTGALASWSFDVDQTGSQTVYFRTWLFQDGVWQIQRDWDRLAADSAALGPGSYQLWVDASTAPDQGVQASARGALFQVDDAWAIDGHDRDLWEATFASYLNDPLWTDRDAYDATHYLMTPLYAAFELGEVDWQQQFGDFFARFVDSGQLPSNRLDRLQFFYLASQFMVLAYQSQQLHLVPDRLEQLLRDELESIWLSPEEQWGTTFVGGMRETIAWKLAQDRTAPSFRRALRDDELYVFAIAGDLQFLSRSRATPYESPLVAEILSLARRAYQQEGQFHDDGGWQLQPGVWADHPDYIYSGHTAVGDGLDPLPRDDIAWDTSHARRLPLWLQSLERAGEPSSDEATFYQEIRGGLARQFHDKVLEPPGDVPIWRLTNFLDGWNGIYRYDHQTFRAGDAVLPYESSKTLMFGWWTFLQSGHEASLFDDLALSFPLSPESVDFYGPAHSQRERHPLITGTEPYHNGVWELMVRMAAKWAHYVEELRP